MTDREAMHTELTDRIVKHECFAAQLWMCRRELRRIEDVLSFIRPGPRRNKPERATQP